jgi:glutaconyl-CoA/methylmalonyl-CoA decarboxylase subunit gamma
MRYYVTLDPTPGAEPVLVDVTELPTGALEVMVGGKHVDVDVVSLRSALSVRIDGHIVDLTTEGSPPEIGAVASGHRSYVRVESERQRAAEAAKKAKGGGSDRVLKSPMPGRVVKVLVKVGDDVAAGQPIMVVEAMKMENELKAKGPAKIGEIHVEAGAAVEAGAKLITFAPPTAP